MHLRSEAQRQASASEQSIVQEDALRRRQASLELLTILVIYFVQGALGLSRLAITFRLKDELGLPPSKVAALLGLTNLPWVLKPLYGFLSDSVPIFGSHRRSYLILSGLLGSAAWAWLAVRGGAPIAIVAGATVASLTVAFSDVVADSIVVERTRAAQERGDVGLAGDLQSFCWLAQSFGGMATAYFSGSLLERFSTRIVFLLTAVLPLLVTVFGARIREEPARPLGGDLMGSAGGTALEKSLDNPRLATLERVRLLWSALSDRRVLLPSLVVFIILAKPSADVPFLFFLNNKLGFGPEMLGRLKLAESVASFLGVLTYKAFLKEVPTQKIFRYTTLAFVPLGLLQVLLVSGYNRRLGIPDRALAFGDDVALAALGQISFMPTLVVAARLCPPGVEGTLFATLMSIDNAGRIIGQETGSLLTKVLGVTESDFTRLPLLIAICTASSLLPLPLLRVFRSLDRTSKA